MIVCLHLQRGQKLRQVSNELALEAMQEGRQVSPSEWLEAAGLSSPQEVNRAIQEGLDAGRRLISSNRGLLYKLASQFFGQVGSCP
jgi:hypothetical protein